jgi:hypothetical protein
MTTKQYEDIICEFVNFGILLFRNKVQFIDDWPNKVERIQCALTRGQFKYFTNITYHSVCTVHYAWPSGEFFSIVWDSVMSYTSNVTFVKGKITSIGGFYMNRKEYWIELGKHGSLDN